MKLKTTSAAIVSLGESAVPGGEECRWSAAHGIGETERVCTAQVVTPREGPQLPYYDSWCVCVSPSVYLYLREVDVERKSDDALSAFFSQWRRGRGEQLEQDDEEGEAMSARRAAMCGGPQARPEVESAAPTCRCEPRRRRDDDSRQLGARLRELLDLPSKGGDHQLLHVVIRQTGPQSVGEQRRQRCSTARAVDLRAASQAAAVLPTKATRRSRRRPRHGCPAVRAVERGHMEASPMQRRRGSYTKALDQPSLPSASLPPSPPSQPPRRWRRREQARHWARLAATRLASTEQAPDPHHRSRARAVQDSWRH